MQNGNIVKVIVEHPDGITDNTYGEVGVITRIGRLVTRPNDPDYEVKTYHSEYLYGKDQIREATPAEIREELRRILMNS